MGFLAEFGSTEAQFWQHSLPIHATRNGFAVSRYQQPRSVVVVSIFRHRTSFGDVSYFPRITFFHPSFLAHLKDIPRQLPTSSNKISVQSTPEHCLLHVFVYVFLLRVRLAPAAFFSRHSLRAFSFGLQRTLSEDVACFPPRIIVLFVRVFSGISNTFHDDY